jgi:hypothetical protein
MSIHLEGEEGNAVCQKPRYRCGHAPVVMEPKGHRHGTARHAREEGPSFLSQCRDAGQGQHSPRAIAYAYRRMAARGSGKRVCLPSTNL